jgi:hypothetical protein
MRNDTTGLREDKQEIVDRINRVFYLDLFSMMLNLQQRPIQITAREVNELSQEKISLLGPVLTRLDFDMLNPLIDAVFYIMYQKGRFPPPPQSLANSPLSVRYMSVLHTEQQAASRLGSMIKLVDFAGMLIQAAPTCVDKIDADQAIDEAGSVLNVPSGIIRADDDVAAIRQQRAKIEQQRVQAQQAAMLPAMASAAKSASQTRIGQGSALDSIIQASGGQSQ